MARVKQSARKATGVRTLKGKKLPASGPLRRVADGASPAPPAPFAGKAPRGKKAPPPTIVVDKKRLKKRARNGVVALR